jgi:hypothetical protein
MNFCLGWVYPVENRGVNLHLIHRPNEAFEGVRFIHKLYTS